MALFRILPLLAILIFGQCVFGQAKRQAAPRPLRPKMTALDRLSRMPAAQRQQELEKMTPERRVKLEDRLEKYNRLPAAQKERLRSQAETFQTLPPGTQDAVRRNFRRFNKLPEDRRLQVRKELRQLQGMPESERNVRMTSEEYRGKYSPGEQQILENLTKVIPVE